MRPSFSNSQADLAGSRHVEEVRDISRSLTEKALHMRAVSYFANIKASLLTLTIFDMKDSKAGLLDEVDRRRHLEKALIKAREEAVAADQAKSTFLASMSHELRTPLNAILGFSQLLQLEGGLNKDQHDYIDKIRRGGEHLLTLINQLLDLAKIEANKLEVEQVDFRLQSVLDNLSDLVGLRAAEKGLELRIEIAPNVPQALKGDPLLLGQILTNLGSNAVKFTQQGTISLNVTIVEQRNNRITLKFCVSDTGIGISPAQQQNLFQSFSQVKSSTSRQYGGTGLGLVICKKLTERMGGRIWVESEAGRGSHFYFTLPLEVNDDYCLQQQTMDNRAISHLRGTSILLVEDNDINQELVTKLLTGHGIRVTTAWNGQEALELLQQETFDGILMDIQMPVMDGYEATREIRKQPRLKDLPIIAMTANVMVGDSDKSVAAGMNDHIGKPLDINRMLNTMARWITPSASLEEVESLPEAAE